MADTYETKKINELSEATSAENSDLMMVGNPTSGQTSKITKENLMKDINTSLTQATNDIAENKIAIEQNASDITEINSALAEYVKILSIEQYSLTISTVASNSSDTASTTITRVSDKSTMYAFPQRSGWLTLNLEIDGTTLTMTGYNGGSYSHGTTARIVVIEVA